VRIAACRGRSANCCADAALPSSSNSAVKKQAILTQMIAFCIPDLRRFIPCTGTAVHKPCQASRLRNVPYLSELCAAGKFARLDREGTYLFRFMTVIVLLVVLQELALDSQDHQLDYAPHSIVQVEFRQQMSVFTNPKSTVESCD
jgi:hypothetical protein